MKLIINIDRIKLKAFSYVTKVIKIYNFTILLLCIVNNLLLKLIDINFTLIIEFTNE